MLAGPPIGAPILLSDGDNLPAVTADTLDQLKPRGSDLSKDAQVIRIGDGVGAAGAATRRRWSRATTRSSARQPIDRFFSAARGSPSTDVVLDSGEQPGVRDAGRGVGRALRRRGAAGRARLDPRPIEARSAQHESPNVFILGPERVICKVVRELSSALAGSVNRVAGPTPVENAIEFARYQQGNFGWGVVVPGYNFTVANTYAAARRCRRGVAGHARRVRAAAAHRRRGRRCPRALESYFLSVQPGYEEDPARRSTTASGSSATTKAVSRRRPGAPRRRSPS